MFTYHIKIGTTISKYFLKGMNNITIVVTRVIKIGYLFSNYDQDEWRIFHRVKTFILNKLQIQICILACSVGELDWNKAPDCLAYELGTRISVYGHSNV